MCLERRKGSEGNYREWGFEFESIKQVEIMSFMPPIPPISNQQM